MTKDKLDAATLKVYKTLEESREHYFITGRAGTGKSTLLKYIRDHTQKKCVVLAPTGVAAVNVGGSTIHSFFRLAPSLPENEGIYADKKRANLFRSLELVIIDEISMVRVDIMDAIDRALRINRGVYEEPFGGAQIICFGDLYQLPPVVESTELMEYFNDKYGGQYFFNANVFKEVPLKHIELKKIFRQKDKDFIALLEKIRKNKMGYQDLNLLNSRVDEEFTLETIGLGYETNESANLTDKPAIILTTNNRKAAAINARQLAALSGEAHSFTAKVRGNFDDRAFPAEQDLQIKPGAQVMMLQNDPEKRWQNGSLGTITSITGSDVLVNIEGMNYLIGPAVWQKMDYTYDRENRTISQVERGSFTQLPLKLAWAITIHKSQGQTFERMIIDLDRGAFAPGQTYVALSRATSLEGITLTRPVRLNDIMVDDAIVNFFEEQAQRQV